MTTITRKLPTEPQFYYTLTDGYRAWAKDLRSAIQSAIYEMTAQRQTSCIVTVESDGSYMSAGELIPYICQKVVFTAALPDPAAFEGAGIQ